MTPAHMPVLYLLCAPVSTTYLFSLGFFFYSSLSLIFSSVQLQNYMPLFLLLMSCVSLCYVNFFMCLFFPVLLGKENGENALISLWLFDSSLTARSLIKFSSSFVLCFSLYIIFWCLFCNHNNQAITRNSTLSCLSQLWLCIEGFADSCKRYSRPSTHVIHLVDQSRRSPQKVYAMQPIRTA